MENTSEAHELDRNIEVRSEQLRGLETAMQDIEAATTALESMGQHLQRMLDRLGSDHAERGMQHLKEAQSEVQERRQGIDAECAQIHRDLDAIYAVAAEQYGNARKAAWEVEEQRRSLPEYLTEVHASLRGMGEALAQEEAAQYDRMEHVAALRSRVQNVEYAAIGKSR